IDNNNDTLGKRIRKAQKQKIPYTLVVGEKEENTQTIAVRSRDDGDLGTITIDAFTKKFL
ncbi:MAG: hypothetical protein KC736_02440, partial [Candidatus Moranbacteria bacterium]|nr:hypothetical protein [Candidatus Moranbacteria bacterium]